MPYKGIEASNTITVNAQKEALTEKSQLLSTTTKQPQWTEENTTSIPVAILNLVKMFLGAAMLSFSWAFSKSTFIPGIIGLIFTSIYSFITCTFIIEACEATQTFEYSALLKYVHPYWETIAAIIVMYICASSLLSYIILIGDFVTDGIHGISPNLQFNYDRQIYIVVICVCILLPLSLLREFKALKARYCIIISV